MLALARSSEEILKSLERVVHRFPDDLTLVGFLDRVAAGEYQVFPIKPDSVMVGRIWGDEVEIVAAAGNMRDILAYEPYFCRWYRDYGYRLFVTRGRRGWLRVLPKLGWRPGYGENEMVKEL